MSYEETIQSLFATLHQINLADSNIAEDWQKSSDASQQDAYGQISKAIVSLAGQDVVDHWSATGELDLSLCDRKPVVKTEHWSAETKTFRRGRLVVELDKSEVDPKDPGNGTPEMVYYTDTQNRSYFATWPWAMDTGELEGEHGNIPLTGKQMEWLEGLEDSIDSFLMS